MPIVIIEFYDSGVRISNGENILASSASCALIESNKSIHVGEKAEHQAHLRPRECNRFFWSRLAENSDTKHIISNAEIALNHLQYLWNLADCIEHDAILITPLTLEKHDLGLLLGICNKLSIKVTGIAANAVLSLQNPLEGCKAIYLDVLQQKLAITEIIQNDTGVSLKQPSHILNFGLQDFIRNCAKDIAQKFISETRFDPLHSARNEQQFFDKLPVWLTMLSDEKSIDCTLSSEDKHYSITVKNDYIQAANKKLFEEVTAYLNVLFHTHSNIAIYCSSACKNIFGIQKFLADIPGSAVIQLDEIDLVAQAARYKDEIITGEQVHYVNTLHWQQGTKTVYLSFSTGRLSNLSSMPSHIVISGHAYSLQKTVYLADSKDNNEVKITLEKTPDSLCRILTNNLSVEIQVLSNQVITLNQDKIEQVATVNVGDILSINGHTNYSFIKVIGDET